MRSGSKGIMCIFKIFRNSWETGLVSSWKVKNFILIQNYSCSLDLRSNGSKKSLVSFFRQYRIDCRKNVNVYPNRKKSLVISDRLLCVQGEVDMWQLWRMVFKWKEVEQSQRLRVCWHWAHKKRRNKKVELKTTIHFICWSF